MPLLPSARQQCRYGDLAQGVISKRALAAARFPARAALVHNKILRFRSCQLITLYVINFSDATLCVTAPSRTPLEMLDRRMNSPMDRVTALVNRLLAERSLQFPAFPDDDLRSVGLSSLDMVNLVLSVESEFDVSIPDTDITPARFRSIATIATLVTALLSVYEVT
jgi:acyl carrier protein